jgi:hypothetical protein
MKSLASLAFGLLLVLAACGKKDKEQPAPPPTPGSASAVAAGSDVGSGSGSAVAAGSGSAVEAPVDVPTEMDYEDLANEEITDKTVEARLKQLETQLAPQ